MSTRSKTRFTILLSRLILCAGDQKVYRQTASTAYKRWTFEITEIYFECHTCAKGERLYRTTWLDTIRFQFIGIDLTTQSFGRSREDVGDDGSFQTFEFIRVFREFQLFSGKFSLPYRCTINSTQTRITGETLPFYRAVRMATIIIAKRRNIL